MRRIATLLYCVVGVALFAQGVRYLTAGEFMAYHQAVVATPWADLDSGVQMLVLGLLKGFGGGAACVGVTVVWLALVPARDRGGESRAERWALWVTPLLAGGYSGLLIYLTGFALLPGATPILVSKVLFALVTSAAALNALARRSQPA